MLEIEGVRKYFPAVEHTSYFNTAAVSLGNTKLRQAYDSYLTDWVDNGFDYVSAEASGETCRALVARILHTDVSNVALVPSVSAAAGLVAAQFLPGKAGENIVVGAQEYSSNVFPWRQLEARGYEIRHVPFVNGGLEPDEVSRHSDGGTRLIAASAIQTATGHRTDTRAISEIAGRSGAWFFLDGAQSTGAVPMAEDVEAVDFLAVPNHKFLLNAGRGMGYLYIRKARQRELLPFNAGWSAGEFPFDSFFGPEMNLSKTASRFDNSKAWFSAVGDRECLELLDRIGMTQIYARNAELGEALRTGLADHGITPMNIRRENRSHIVSVPLKGRSSEHVIGTLKAFGVAASVRSGQLRLSPHFYNNHDDVSTCIDAVHRAFR